MRLAILVLLLFVGCARSAPPYVCVPAWAPTGQQVILCQPYAGQVDAR